MNGYGSCKWTCGECGESYEASGVVADSQVDRWASRHREHHRVEKLPSDEQAEYWNRKIRTQMLSSSLAGTALTS